eukprot:11877082-Ditylum_brightwellii.AAC.1
MPPQEKNKDGCHGTTLFKEVEHVRENAWCHFKNYSNARNDEVGYALLFFGTFQSCKNEELILISHGIEVFNLP